MIKRKPFVSDIDCKLPIYMMLTITENNYNLYAGNSD